MKRYGSRSNSCSPVALLTVFALLALVAIGIGIGFTAFGAWPILPFAGLEALALGIAFLATARRAGDYGKADSERMER